VTILLF